MNHETYLFFEGKLFSGIQVSPTDLYMISTMIDSWQ